MSMSFEPKIVAFLCNWCSYAGADLAGVSRYKCAPNVMSIRLMCSGGLEPSFVLKAFKEGADGVLVCGCNLGDCHYTDGNYKTLMRMTLLKKLTEQLGIEEPRLRLQWVCASCAEEFSNAVNKITEDVRALGPYRKEKVEVESGSST
jgi:F420-non-reducing hydrogenase iron-sulfur subunit